jgi:hypothetical protein
MGTTSTSRGAGVRVRLKHLGGRKGDGKEHGPTESSQSPHLPVSPSLLFSTAGCGIGYCPKYAVTVLGVAGVDVVVDVVVDVDLDGDVDVDMDGNHAITHKLSST